MSKIANVSAVLHVDNNADEIPDEMNRLQLRALATLIEAKGFPIEGTYNDSESRLQQRRVEKRKAERAFPDLPPDIEQQQQQQQKQQPATKKPFSSNVVVISNENDGDDDDNDCDTLPETPVAPFTRDCVINTSAYSDRLRVLFKSVTDKVATLDKRRAIIADNDSAHARPSTTLSLQIAGVQKKIHERLDGVMEWIVALEKMQALEASIQHDSAELARSLLELRKKCE